MNLALNIVLNVVVQRSPSLLSTFLLLTLIGGGGVGCDESNQSTMPIELIDQFVEVQCQVEENECPNACVYGQGVLGESCQDSTSCGCGLFCKESQCALYEGDYAGCLCKDGFAPSRP